LNSLHYFNQPLDLLSAKKNILSHRLKLVTVVSQVSKGTLWFTQINVNRASNYISIHRRAAEPHLRNHTLIRMVILLTSKGKLWNSSD